MTALYVFLSFSRGSPILIPFLPFFNPSSCPQCNLIYRLKPNGFDLTNNADLLKQYSIPSPSKHHYPALPTPPPCDYCLGARQCVLWGRRFRRGEKWRYVAYLSLGRNNGLFLLYLIVPPRLLALNLPLFDSYSIPNEPQFSIPDCRTNKQSRSCHKRRPHKTYHLGTPCCAE